MRNKTRPKSITVLNTSSLALVLNGSVWGAKAHS